MANGKKAGGNPPKGKTPVTKPPVNPPPNPGEGFKTTDARLAHVESLMEQLADERSIATARELAAEAKVLEDYFRGLRLQALAAADGEAALQSIRSAVPQPRPIPPAPPAVPALLLPGSPPEFVTATRLRAMGLPRIAAGSVAPAASPASTTTGDSQPGIDLSDFFQHVCESIVTAQRQLDTSSSAYAMDCKSAGMPPALFSIPNVKAEVKIGFSVGTDKGIRAIIFNDSSQIQQYGESTVSFEVAAAPPPPGGLDKFPQPTRFLFPGLEQNNLFTLIDHLRGGFTPAAQAILDAQWKTRAVVMRLPQNAPGLLKYLVMVPALPSGLLLFQVTDKDHVTAGLTLANDVVASFVAVLTAIRFALASVPV